ncbi:hypothetical protein NEOLI_002776 [Neolecta irregularis DAH-3]|uniref:Uncharacterized protein n=1 Tax=Neolecta irregularis (strain DAH-3) TaxID=1198029 RepID=A0A1U7LQL0_NEOID|nr:hypothetical protein NEOLI_002776 [Neolecta irregularis DAH-3]|eukprot:OLL24960.1 hypothetical protein NEOLI_002776 [Neolecta irregularis DAH-3]
MSSESLETHHPAPSYSSQSIYLLSQGKLETIAPLGIPRKRSKFVNKLFPKKRSTSEQILSYFNDYSPGPSSPVSRIPSRNTDSIYPSSESRPLTETIRPPKRRALRRTASEGSSADLRNVFRSITSTIYNLPLQQYSQLIASSKVYRELSSTVSSTRFQDYAKTIILDYTPRKLEGNARRMLYGKRGESRIEKYSRYAAIAVTGWIAFRCFWSVISGVFSILRMVEGTCVAPGSNNQCKTFLIIRVVSYSVKIRFIAMSMKTPTLHSEQAH